MADYQKQLEFLKRSVELGRVPHGIMFSSLDEVGAKKVALEFVKFINCSSEKKSQRPCYNCENCKKIENGAHPDFLFIEPSDSGEIEISQIRDFIWRFSLKEFAAPFKIAIINKAHLMNQESQNCLLKVLEEPKGKAILILLTPYPHLFLPTIISRVQKLRFQSEKELALEGILGYNEEIISDLLKMVKSDLAFRFRYVKNLSEEDKEKIENNLNIWNFYLRAVLLKKLGKKEADLKDDFKGYSLKKMAEIISLIQETCRLLSTTNINPKLALENFLIEL